MQSWAAQLEDWIRWACETEVTSNKPGNVTPDSAFAETTVSDFLLSAKAVAPVLAQDTSQSVGETILQSVQATQLAVQQNTNLGIILLLAPLSRVPEGIALQDGIEQVLNQLTVDDAVQTYKAIALAAPGGLGAARDQDVVNVPSVNLRSCMQLAADRDLIAAQYTNGFADVLTKGVDWLLETAGWTSYHQYRLAWVSLQLMAHYGDSLILRKCGERMNAEVQNRAAEVLQSGWPESPHSVELFADFDRFLRADGNQRNPGTSADMIAAILFAAVRNQQLNPQQW